MVGLLLCAMLSQADVRIAPPPPPWPENAPAPLITPTDLRCFVEDSTGARKEVSEVGLWLPDELAGIIAGRLESLAAYPARCQARLDALERIHRVVLSGAVEAAWMDARSEALAPAGGGWAWWEVALAAGTGIAIGFAAGAVVVAVAR